NIVNNTTEARSVPAPAAALSLTRTLLSLDKDEKHQGHATWIWETATYICDFCEPRRRKPAAIFVPGTNGIAELPFGSLTDGDTDAVMPTGKKWPYLFVVAWNAIINNYFYHSKTNIGQAFSVYYLMRISRIPKYNFNPMVNKTHVVWIYFVVLIL
ncbi:hypothetical protein NQ317_014009, partial [Molorchus minor]